MACVIISKKPFQIKIIDTSSGKAMLDDKGPGVFTWSDNWIKKSFIQNDNQHFFGLGMHDYRRIGVGTQGISNQVSCERFLLCSFFLQYKRIWHLRQYFPCNGI